MIWFNEESILDVAPVRIVDVLVSPIRMTPTARQRPIKWGADFVRMTGGERTVDIEFALLTDSAMNRQEQLRQLARWARQAAPGALRIDGHEGVHLSAVCTGLPEPSYRQWWESKLRITFTCFEPYWLSDIPQAKAFSSGSVSAYIAGDAPALARIAWTNTAVSDWAFASGGRTMAFEGIPAGDVVIDLNRQTAACGGVSVMEKFVLSPTNAFILPACGNVEINCATTAADTPVLRWVSRWE